MHNSDRFEWTASSWLVRLKDYRLPDNYRSTGEIAITAFPFVGLWLLTALSYQISIWLSLALAVPTAVLMVRLFMIQHDCGHGAMFTARKANDWVGRTLGILTLTPYDFWRHSHALHHAGSGNLDLRGIGDIDTLTVREYQALSPARRLGYRLYRHPLVMFGIGPAYLFIFRHRLPFGAMKGGMMPWASTLLTNVSIVLLAAPLVYVLGFWGLLAVHLPILLIGASIGVWLFYVQHQFETTLWQRSPQWKHADAALHGSSFYDLPQPLMWLTGNIGIHHLHHLCSKIPFYRLPKVLEDYPELRSVGRITLRQSFACIRLNLWDEEHQRLVPFSAVSTA